MRTASRIILAVTILAAWQLALHYLLRFDLLIVRNIREWYLIPSPRLKAVNNSSSAAVMDCFLPSTALTLWFVLRFDKLRPAWAITYLSAVAAVNVSMQFLYGRLVGAELWWLSGERSLVLRTLVGMILASVWMQFVLIYEPRERQKPSPTWPARPSL